MLLALKDFIKQCPRLFCLDLHFFESSKRHLLTPSQHCFPVWQLEKWARGSRMQDGEQDESEGSGRDTGLAARKGQKKAALDTSRK